MNALNSLTSLMDLPNSSTAFVLAAVITVLAITYTDRSLRARP